MKVSTITLGCKVNQYETQAMLNQLLQGGFSACQTGEDADIILLNSCTVTSTSDHKVKQTLHKARREHPHAVIVLTGCMPQAFPELADDRCRYCAWQQQSFFFTSSYFAIFIYASTNY